MMSLQLARRLIPALFVLALWPSPVTSAPPSPTGTNEVTVQVIETGSGAPGATYVVELTGVDFNRSVEIAAGQTVSISEVPAGTFDLSERDAPPGATIEPSQVTVTDMESVAVVVTNPYPAGRIRIFRPPNQGVANCAVHITRHDSSEPSLVVPIEMGETVTTGWLPLGGYNISFPTIKSMSLLLDYRLDVDGATQDMTACYTVFPRPHPYGRIAIDVVENGTPRGSPYTFVIAWNDSPVYDGPPNDPFEATVTAGTTWISKAVPAGNYLITATDAPDDLAIVPNPVALPWSCGLDSSGDLHYCQGDDPPTLVTVTVGSAGSISPPPSAPPAPASTGSVLPGTGNASAGVAAAATGLIIAGGFMLLIGRSPRHHASSGVPSMRRGNRHDA
jgi:hypothetical protein